MAKNGVETDPYRLYTRNTVNTVDYRDRTIGIFILKIAMHIAYGKLQQIELATPTSHFTQWLGSYHIRIGK